MLLSRTDAEVDLVLARADTDIDRLKAPHDQYALGIAIGIRWALGESDLAPYDTPATIVRRPVEERRAA